jgi:hypothetical protein
LVTFYQEKVTWKNSTTMSVYGTLTPDSIETKNTMDDQKQQIVEKLKSANNILVTVSSNPSVDQLAACIGMTLMLNKLDKHATAVFSGEVPDTIDFLKPEETLEKNTDSLRDFIIALDKSKADKLRYKVEDRVVKIFITPYRTSLSEKDLNFSQGDFNVDVVLALGVKQQSELDQAITSHGRILHDAVVMCVNNTPGGELGSVNWQKTDASSLSELVAELAKLFDKPLLDSQVATALLTGIVAETDRFRNQKTAASTMSVSADLMNAGANQQLVAAELDHEVKLQNNRGDSDQPQGSAPKADDGMLEIAHEEDKPAQLEPEMELPEPEESPQDDHGAEIFDEHPTNESAESIKKSEEKPDEAGESHDSGRTMITEPPTFDSQLTANAQPENGDGSGMSMPKEEPQAPILERDPPQPPPVLDSTSTPLTPPEPPEFQESELPKPTAPVPPMPPQPLRQPAAAYEPPQFSAPQPPTPPEPAPAPPPAPTPPVQHETLSQLEESVHSPHSAAAASGDEVQHAREEVMKALNEQPNNALPPVEALNAQPLDLGKPPEMNQPMGPTGPGLPPMQPEQPPFANSPADQPMTMPMPPGVNLPPPQSAPPTNAQNPSTSPLGPPPTLPPPMTPPTH